MKGQVETTTDEACRVGCLPACSALPRGLRASILHPSPSVWPRVVSCDARRQVGGCLWPLIGNRRERGVNLPRVSEKFALMEDDGTMVLSDNDDDMLMDSEGDQESDGR